MLPRVFFTEVSAERELYYTPVRGQNNAEVIVMKEKHKRKLRRVLGVYAVTAFAVLAILAALFAGHLSDFRTAARYSYELSFEQTAAAVDALSGTLEKCRYATGELCHGLASEAYAEVCAAKSALSTLPFSTVEMERTKSFLGAVGELTHGLCARSGEFTDDERSDIAALSDTAAAYGALVQEMRGALGRGELRMDSRERQIRNVLPEDGARLLSADFLDAEQNFPVCGELRTCAPEETATAEQYVDPAPARAAAAKLLGVAEELLRDEYGYADGSAAFSRGTVTVRADARRALSLIDSRLVSESSVSEKRAAEKAREFLSAAGCENMRETSRRRSGNVLYLSFNGLCGDALCADCRAEVGVALDNCSIYSFRAPESLPEEELSWPLTPEAAQAALPSALTPLGSRKVVYAGRPCYAFDCVDGERQVEITVDAEYGRELAIEVKHA